LNTSQDEKKWAFQARQKYRMTANMVPVWSITKSRVISGLAGSNPMSFSATITWAELDTGSSSAKPWTTARMRI
jgi:hypothetical protein